MNYEKHYNMLIERGKTRTLTGYVERHHIVPKCLGGNDDADNLVTLTPEEHYLAHLLLVKMYPKCTPLVQAAVIMTSHNTSYRVNNKLYGWLRRRASVARKQHLTLHGHPKGMLGKKHDINNLQNITSGIRKASAEKRIVIYAYELDGTFYKQYDSIIECADDLKTSPSNVKYTADGKFKHCKKKQLRYEYNESIDPYVKPKLPKRVRTKEHCENISKAKKGKKMPEGWAEQHSEAMKNYHTRKKEIKALTGYSRIGRNNI
jgi:hypothetical protein